MIVILKINIYLQTSIHCLHLHIEIIIKKNHYEKNRHKKNRHEKNRHKKNRHEKNRHEKTFETFKTYCVRNLFKKHCV